MMIHPPDGIFKCTVSVPLSIFGYLKCLLTALPVLAYLRPSQTSLAMNQGSPPVLKMCCDWFAYQAKHLTKHILCY